MFADQTLAGIIRICPDLGSEGSEERSLAALFATWGNEQASNPHPLAPANRLAGTLAGPRQHKVRANLDQIRAELERELTSFQRQRTATT